MRSHRRCSRNGCRSGAVATLTYVYVDSTAVVGPLATIPEPHTYDLCEDHARNLTAPRGWDLVRHVDDYASPMPSGEDLVALADAVRESARNPVRPPEPQAPPRRGGEPNRPMSASGGRPRLRVVGGKTEDDTPPSPSRNSTRLRCDTHPLLR